MNIATQLVTGIFKLVEISIVTYTFVSACNSFMMVWLKQYFPQSDYCVEMLHTILLGAYKYLLKMPASLQCKATDPGPYDFNFDGNYKVLRNNYCQPPQVFSVA